jgi:hypothetical protein
MTKTYEKRGSELACHYFSGLGEGVGVGVGLDVPSVIAIGPTLIILFSLGR